MGQALKFCTRCENKRGCDLCADLHEWIMEHLDAVSVVRCRECTEFDETEHECSHWCGFRENDFCSYGKRKEEV